MGGRKGEGKGGERKGEGRGRRKEREGEGKREGREGGKGGKGRGKGRKGRGRTPHCFFDKSNPGTTNVSSRNFNVSSRSCLGW